MAKVLRWIRKQCAKICSCLKSGEADHEDTDDNDFWDDIVAQQENVVPEAKTEEQPVEEEKIAMKADWESKNKSFEEDTDTDVVLEEGKEQESVEVVAQTIENTSVSVDEPIISDPQESVFLEEVNDSESDNEPCISSSDSETTSEDGEFDALDIFEDDTSLHSNKFQLVKKDMETVSSSSTSNESSSESSVATDSEIDAMNPQMPKKTHVSIFLEEFWDD
ncbi:hypothetical protein JTE90_025122 [Oedothorax gibbosus]|uniref:Uncharacterized protein n=1 Tax=Oedothorax gibbosus TaxID=931172 RepID=A0AAV6UGQ8_9ARAC|nr:hypothetical protein JTE90_025122 [Oedothorax gibbosus]